MSEERIWMQAISVGREFAAEIEDCAATGWSPPKHTGCNGHLSIVHYNEMEPESPDSDVTLYWVCACGVRFYADTTSVFNS